MKNKCQCNCHNKNYFYCGKCQREHVDSNAVEGRAYECKICRQAQLYDVQTFGAYPLCFECSEIEIKKTSFPEPMSMQCLFFTTLEEMQNFQKELNKRVGMKLRFMFVGDLGIAFDEHFEENVEWLQPYVQPIMKRFINKIPLKNLGLKTVGMTPFNYKEFDKIYKMSTRHPLGETGLTPISVDTRYKKKAYFTEEHQRQLDMLLKLDTGKPYRRIKSEKVSPDSKKWHKGGKITKYRKTKVI